MKTEYEIQSHHQNSVEQDALPPSQDEPKPTTDDIIIRGVDSYEPQPTPENQPDFDTLFETIKAEYKQEFETGLDFKVKSELVAQIFSSYKNPEIPNGYVNLNDMRLVITQQISDALGRHLMQAQVIENEWIPAAKLRPHWTPQYDKPTDFLVKDIPVLEAREEAHLNMVEYLNELQPIDKEVAFELTDAYVARFIEDARVEVVAILVQRQKDLKAELKRQKEELDRKAKELEENEKRADNVISELQVTITQLKDELSSTRTEVKQRDIEMLNNEMDVHLIKEAQGLAA
jgi:hypothetical protein